MDMSIQKREMIEATFRAKDTNKNGVIDRSEFAACLMSVGFFPTPDDLQFLYNQFDASGDGVLQIDELMNNLDIIHAHGVKGDEFMKAFKKFDRSGDGYISARELQAILTMEGENQMGEAEAKALIAHVFQNFDKNRDGKLNYAEFIQMCLTSPKQLTNLPS